MARVMKGFYCFNSSIVLFCRTKVIVMVDRNELRSPCMASGGRRKRQTNGADLVHFNKTLLSAALIASQSSIQDVRYALLLNWLRYISLPVSSQFCT